MKKILLTACCFLTTSIILFAQKQTITGKVSDAETGVPQAFTNVIIKGSTLGTSTDIDGNFSIEVDFSQRDTLFLQTSFVGFEPLEIAITKSSTFVELKMEPMVIMAKEVVISASRVSESLTEAPVDIQKLNSKKIESSASGDFYQSLGNLKGIDIVTSSMGFKTVNQRGFNTTSPIRSVQFIDGMDNQAPGLNFPLGNMLGASDLDLESIEIISGAASALYGANAFQGVINMTTKDPFKHEGLSVMAKGGSRNYLEGQLRYAEVFGKDRKFAVKFNASYLTADDWTANDPEANLYGDIETEVDLTKIIREKQYDQSLTQEERDDFLALNTYLGFFPVANPGKLDVESPGYMETSLAKNKTNSLKTGLGLYYKFSEDIRAEFLYKFGMGTAVYQGTNRYSVKDIRFQQQKLQLQGKNFTLKAYNTTENAGNSYDIVFTGINIAKESIKDYVSEYLGTYFDTYDVLTNGFKDDGEQWITNRAHEAAASAAPNAWILAGSHKFDSLRNIIINDPDLQTGSKFQDKSSLQHYEGQYNVDKIEFLDIITGASFRRYNPNSYGTIFSDTLKNSGDTLNNGRSNPDAEYVDISTYEYGAYAQATKKLLDNKLKVIGSFRLDKNKNYDFQYSPRLSFVYTHQDHTFRISAQQAFRAPTLQDQYLFLDLGPIKLQGNLNGITNLYTQQSVKDFLAMNDSIDANGKFVGEIRPELLKAIELEAIKPEQVKSFEAGYRGIITDGLYIDITGYYSLYTNFIGSTRVYKLINDESVAGEESGQDAILTHNDNNPTYELMQYPINAKSSVSTYGATVGLSYYINKTYTATANYTYSDIDTTGIGDDVIPGFNTPKHKYNLGFEGKRVWKDFGYGVNYKWTDSFYWQSPFGDGPIKAYSNVDLQLNYLLKQYDATLRVGAANLLNQGRIEAYGSPTIGRFIYTSITVNL